MYFNNQISLGTDYKFVLREIMCETSTSVLYKGVNQSGDFVVVKRAHESKEYIDCLKREYACYQKLRSDNICHLFAYEQVKNNHFLIIEYCEMGSLRDLLDQGAKFSFMDIKKVAYSLLLALVEVHKQGIIHRDVKCANVLLNGSRTCKLADFGHSAISINENDAILNLIDSFKGTLYWMAPEVVLQKQYDTKADIWSLGCTILELVTTRTPWRKFENYFEAIHVIGRTNEVPDIPYETSDVLKDFLEKCLKKNPRERCSASELLTHNLFESF